MVVAKLARRPPGIEDGEAWIDTVGGQKIVFPTYIAEPEGVAYVRFVDERGVEVLYYDYWEWADAPQEVMGAILGAMARGATDVGRSKD